MLAIIEYLYMHYKAKVLRTTFPVYLIQIVSYFLMAVTSFDQDKKLVIDVLNIVGVIYTFIMILISLKFVGFTMFEKPWVYIDIMYILFIGTISINTLLVSMTNKSPVSEENIRTLSAACSILIFGKMIYFLQIVDQVAPLINIIIKIFYDIGWFVIILMVFVFAFSNSFYILAKNQTKG